MTTIMLTKEGAPREDQSRGFVSAALRAFGVDVDMSRLEPRDQLKLLEMWHEVRTDNDGFHLPSLSGRQRKQFQRLLSRAAGADVDMFVQAEKNEAERDALQQLAARAFRADRTQREARGFQVRLFTVLSEFANKWALGLGDLGMLALLLSLWESGNVSGFYDVRIEDGAIITGPHGGFARAASRGEAINKPLEMLQVAEWITLERGGNRETIIRKGRLLLAIENDELTKKAPR